MRQTSFPTGTVTLLFTDIEGSTSLWESSPDAMRGALACHDEIVRASIEANGGYVFKTMGDAFCAAFHTAPEAVAAALDAQQSLLAERWQIDPPVRARMALHAGVADERDGDYFGQSVNRVARLLAAGHGGQTLVSAVAQELIRDALPDGCSLQDMGDASLKDLARPERVYQLKHPDLPSEFPPLRTLNSVELPNNLPQQPTSFIGREKEIADVTALLLKTRLLTLVGAGGAGKTRLALQAAADLLEGEGDGVWLVELAPLSDPALVPGALAQTLGVKETAGEPIQKTLVNALKSKSLLIVLDNCEHVLSACCSLATDILRGCSNVHLLATSREPLGASGEQVYRIPSLSVPSQAAANGFSGKQQAHTAESLSQYESVRLFIERAQAVQPSFAVNDSNAPAVAQLCHRLDGIPLAIELAAARVRSMPVEQVNARLDSRFKLLTGGSRSNLPRQQTLRALIDWSYDLLSEQERAMLARLSVFADGWTLEAAEAVCSGDAIEEWEALDLLTSLTDKSLVVYGDTHSDGEGDNAARYRLLESIRQYGQDRLAESGEAEARATHGGHAAWCTWLAEAAVPQLKGAMQARWLADLETEHDNLRAALAWYEQERDGSAMLRLAVAVQLFWDVRGHYSEGRGWLTRALECAGAPTLDEGAQTPPSPELLQLRAKALGALGTLVFSQADYAVAGDFYKECLALNRASGDQSAIANTLLNLGGVARNLGDYVEARALLEESLAISRQVRDEHQAAYALINLGNVALSQGDLADARQHYQASSEINRRLGNLRGTAIAVGNLGVIAYELGDPAAGIALMQEKLDIHRQLGDQKGTASALLNLGIAAKLQADLATARGLFGESLSIALKIGDQETIAQLVEELADVSFPDRAERAARLWSAASALRERLGAPLASPEQQEINKKLDDIRAALGAMAFKAAWSAGRTMTTEQAVEYAQFDSE